MIDPMQAAEEALQAAVSNHAGDELHRRLADDFRFAGGSSGQLDKQGWIRAACAVLWKTFAFVHLASTGDERVRVVQATLDQEGEIGGRDVSGSWLLTDTWVHREGGWKLLARHASPASARPVDTSAASADLRWQVRASSTGSRESVRSDTSRAESRVAGQGDRRAPSLDEDRLVPKATAGEQLAAALEGGDLDAIRALYAIDAVMYHPLMPEGVRGREAIRDSEAELLTAFSDVRVEVRSVLEAPRASAVEVVVRAVNDGPLDVGDAEPMPPTGRRIELRSVWWFELDEHGLVIEERDYFDSAALMSQLGLDGP